MPGVGGDLRVAIFGLSAVDSQSTDTATILRSRPLSLIEHFERASIVPKISLSIRIVVSMHRKSALAHTAASKVWNAQLILNRCGDSKVFPERMEANRCCSHDPL